MLCAIIKTRKQGTLDINEYWALTRRMCRGTISRLYRYGKIARGRTVHGEMCVGELCNDACELAAGLMVAPVNVAIKLTNFRFVRTGTRTAEAAERVSGQRQATTREACEVWSAELRYSSAVSCGFCADARRLTRRGA